MHGLLVLILVVSEDESILRGGDYRQSRKTTRTGRRVTDATTPFYFRQQIYDSFCYVN